MGLIQAALSAAGSTIRDQWKEYFYCDAIPNDTIAVKGKKRVTGFSSNNGNDNVITNGSIIAVADGQCMIIVENGQVVEICAEPGEFKYDSNIAPSIFTGTLGDAVKTTFAEIGKRFVYGGQVVSDQRIYYFNTKELLGAKYGTPNQIPFRVVNEKAGIDLTVSVKCFGEYSYIVADPILFYTNVCGNFTGEYKRDQIEGQMKAELLDALQPAFSKISDQGIRYTSLPGRTKELRDALAEELNEKWAKLRGIELVSLSVASIKADEKDEETIKEMEREAAYIDPNRAAAALANSKRKAMQDAANNAAGAGVGFMNLNMASNAGSDEISALYAQGNAKPAAPAAPAANEWVCPNCGTKNTKNFCGECGTPKPSSNKWICPECGTENDAKFCGNCGTKKPE